MNHESQGKGRRAQSVNNSSYKDCVYEVEKRSMRDFPSNKVLRPQMMPMKGLCKLGLHACRLSYGNSQSRPSWC